VQSVRMLIILVMILRPSHGPDSVLPFLHTFFSLHSHRAGAIISPILLMRKLRFKEVK
jgi:hypothetical protein